MLHAKAKWNITEADDDQVEKLAQELQIEPLLARLLIARGMTNIEQAKAFLDEGTDWNHDPFLLDGMGEAVSRIRLAIEQGEKIRIYGDYDADGISSTVLMIHLLNQMQAAFDYYIPHRIHEGYGLNNKALDLALQHGVQLIITVDTGISAVEEIAYARQLGLEVIVTDHHEPPEHLPQECIIINPKKPGCPYPFKQLAGVGVAFKLAQALLGRWPSELLEFAAIGTVADLMPLLNENRMIVKQGLKRMQSSSNPGIRALFDAAGINLKDVNSTHIGFTLAPRINASGRLEHADDAVRLLITDNQQDAEQMAYQLDQLNKERQRIVEEMTKQAYEIVQESKSAPLKQVLVVAQEDWNVGVVGIVASKLVDKYYRPTLVLSIDKETGLAKGSARSIAGYDLYQALSHCQDLLDHYGGHQAAAGLTLSREHLPELERRLNLLAEEWLCSDDFTPYMNVDMVCSLKEIGVTTVQQLELLGPFGMGNPTPKVIISNAAYKELRTIGKEQQHVKITLKTSKDESAATLDAVGFHKSALLPWISSTAAMDVLGELSINEWNGVRKPQVMIQDLRIAHMQMFDWRGIAKIEPKLAELAERVDGRSSGGDARAGILMFHASNTSMLGSIVNKLPVWVLAKENGSSLMPSNELARQSNLSMVTDMILFDLPSELSSLGAALSSAVGMERVYAIFYQGGTVYEGALPSRDMFKTVYGAVQQQAAASPSAAFIASLSKRSGLSSSLIQFILDVFTEVGLITQSAGSYRLVVKPDKKDLTQSQIYQNRQLHVEVEQALLYSSAQELHEWLMEQKQQSNKPLLEGII
ncbi:single-stranded-DNA-specific exonuclease RecJ [Paenibacillus sp. FSL H7-0331]|uniref:single-stranded-DNA-specific exonuclease RecJ n=1 Tax=Paenibacillus sp. FSL H7-0331 TaxID=1920421 RepID=UPI00096CB161|nr:single-stranded-DNA-specific exonuclease RecJ [Paenibacillus sp. FSL H7-0331]OMF15722.1 single-stranded-DNA-specific exonuclease RecJ [Paenibacillus sp. FSL H7-0331]